MQRRHFVTLAATALLGLALSGCGSSNSTKTEGTGRLADVEISPVPGATFISRDSEFTLFWPTGTEPPAQFAARIYQVDGAGEITELPSSLVRDGQEFRWFLRPTSVLTSRAAVYVELSASGQTSLDFAYIAGRAQLAAKISVHPLGEVALVHHVNVR